MAWAQILTLLQMSDMPLGRSYMSHLCVAVHLCSGDSLSIFLSVVVRVRWINIYVKSLGEGLAHGKSSVIVIHNHDEDD